LRLLTRVTCCGQNVQSQIPGTGFAALEMNDCQHFDDCINAFHLCQDLEGMIFLVHKIITDYNYENMPAQNHKSNSLALFVTCLVDQVYPQIGVSITRVLSRAGFEVEFPLEQTCCGQPFYNSGFVKEAKRLAKRTIEIFLDYPAVVLPSGSCTTMIRTEYPHIFKDDQIWSEKTTALAAKTFEFTEFLVKNTHLDFKSPGDGQVVTYHDSCHMNRTLGIRDQPRMLLKQAGFQIAEMTEVSQAMTEEKLSRALQTEAQILVSSDPGCIMQMRNQISTGSSIQIKHIAEVLEEVTR
jgi:L-lactate dehydrogenase complex protein LldE